MPKTIEEKLNNGVTYRNATNIEIREKEDENEDYIVEGYATTFNQPYVLWEEEGYRLSEQVDARAFDKCDMRDVIFQYNHEGRVFARNKNHTLNLSIDENGLKVRANLGGTQAGRELYEEIKGGYTTKMSFGFTVAEDRVDWTKSHEMISGLRTITNISKLFDVSAVSIPANDATEISARSFCEGVIAEAKAECRRKEQREMQKKKIKILMEVHAL